MPPNQFGAQNTSAPATTTGSIKRGNPTASRPLRGVSAGTTRNWGSNTAPPTSGGIAGAIGDNLAFNMRYGRNPFGGLGKGGKGGRRTTRSAGGTSSVTTSASDGSDTIGGGAAGGGVTINWAGSGATFGDQTNLGATFEGGAPAAKSSAMGSSPAGGDGRSTSGPRFGDQSNLGATYGGQGAVGGGEFSQPQTKTRKPLTPEQKMRNNETAKARRGLASDIKKNGDPEQQRRIEEEGVAGGKKRQAKTKTAAAPATTRIDARNIQANQSDASTKSFGSDPTGGGSSAPGASFIGNGAVTGAKVTFGDSGLQVEGGKIGKNELAS